MRKIVILVILPSFSGGGAERVILSFLKHLSKIHFKYILLMQNTLGPLKNDISGENIIDLDSKRFRRAFPKVIKKINSIKPDIILSTFPHITLALLVFRILLPKNTLIVSREPNMVKPSLKNSPFSFILKFLHKMYMPTVDIIIVTSKAMYKDFIHRGVNHNKICLIQNPIDHIALRKVKKLSRFPGKGLRLVYVGRLVYQKGLDRILPLLESVKDVHLTILGEGPEVNNLKNIVVQLRIEKKVKFFGYSKHANGCIAAADYLVLPSRWEGLPNVVLESLVLGTPVVSFKEIVGLYDLISVVSHNSLYFCEDEDKLQKLLEYLPVRKDYINPRIRKSLIRKYNSPKVFTDNLSEILKEKFFESKK